MDFDPRDYDSRDDECFNERHGGGNRGSYDHDHDDDVSRPDIRSRHRDDDARTLGRGPGDSRSSHGEKQVAQ